MKRYNINLAPRLDRDLENIAEDMGVTKSEIVRRALVLFKHAAAADEIKFIKGTEETMVFLK